jgi:integral membrane sensor domain MASE1
MIQQDSIWLKPPVVGAGYFALAFVCLSISRFGAPVESVWLANALLAAALMVTPTRRWAATLGCAAAGHVLAHLATFDVIGQTLAFLVADLVEAMLVAGLVGAKTMAFANWRQILWFLLCGALIGPAASGTIAAAASALAGWPMQIMDIQIWMAADALGMIIFLPLMFGFGHGRWQRVMGRKLHLALALALVIGFSAIAAVYTQIPALRLVLLPVMVVVAFELGVGGAVLALVALMATWTTMAVNGVSPVPWAQQNPRETLLTTQIFLAVFAATILPLAVVIEQKQRLTDTLSETLKETREAWGAIIGAEARYRLVVDNVTESVLRVEPGGLIAFARPASGNLLDDTELVGKNLFTLMEPRDAAMEQESFDQSEAKDLLNLVCRRTWRLRIDRGESILVDARVTMVATGKTGAREFIVVLRPLV